MLYIIGNEIARDMEDIEFVGVQKGFGNVPDCCMFNCMITKTTIMGNDHRTISEKLEKVRKDY